MTGLGERFPEGLEYRIVYDPTAFIQTSIDTVLVLAAMVPSITGQFYKQFAVNISVATVISTINSLKLSPALAGVLLRGHSVRTPSRNPLIRLVGLLAVGFNTFFDWITRRYTAIVRTLVS